jgi:hypothetical protein
LQVEQGNELLDHLRVIPVYLSRLGCSIPIGSNVTGGAMVSPLSMATEFNEELWRLVAL